MVHVHARLKGGRRDCRGIDIDQADRRMVGQKMSTAASRPGEWRAQQLKGRVHPVEQSNTDDAEQQDG